MKKIDNKLTTVANPSHKDGLIRLNKAIGQLNGVKVMIEDNRYCADILTQLYAVRSAIKALELVVLNKHLDHCVADSFSNKNSIEEAGKKIEEIKNLLSLTNRN